MILPNFANASLLVIGDVMLDTYLYGDIKRISPEAPVPIAHIKKDETRPGGAANVAVNISALGSKVKLLGLVGNDKEADLLEKKLNQAQVNSLLIRIPSLPTIKKTRVIGHQQQLLRLDFEEKFHDIEYALDKLQIEFEKYLSKVDLVILSDYGKGTLSKAQNLIKIAKNHNKPLLVDPKNRDFSLYQKATIITPNLEEFELVAGTSKNENELTEKALLLCQKYGFSSMLITRGEQGMSLISKDQKPLHLTTEAHEVYDVTGAGDTVIAALGASLASGHNLKNSAIIANQAAGIAIGKLGAVPVSQGELQKALNSQRLNNEKKLKRMILTEKKLFQKIVAAKAKGEKIVMTNGCFDILHYGHIESLKKAKTFGDKLIVAINDDNSVKKLKGPQRPITPLFQRMAILAELRNIDWIIPFSEDTPERLIKILKPDVLVKSGDYKINEIAGSDFILQNGGEIKIIPLIKGVSSSKLIDQLQEDF